MPSPTFPSTTAPVRAIRTAALASVLALVVLPFEARAQNFLEELFGIGRAARPPVPPRPVPTPAPEPGTAPGGEAPAPEARPSAPPQPRQPVVLRAPGEDNVLNQDLALNGLAGTLRLERGPTGVTALVTLPGTKVSQPTETCTVRLNDGKPVPFTPLGRLEGVTRYEASAPECPLRLDVLEGSVLATTLAGGTACTFTAADCETTPAGLWGPGAAALIPQAGEFDSARGVADRAVRDNYKIMTQRARGQDVRPIVQEQAAFSSDREQICRTYAREGAHGYCHLRVSEARALSLAARLGANTATPSASAAVSRPRRPRPAVEGMNPDPAGAGEMPVEP